MKTNQTIRQFANEICMQETELAYAQHTPVEDDKKFVLLNGLRPEFYVKKAILQEQNICSEEIVSTLEVTENEISERNPRNSENNNNEHVFIADTSNLRCHLYKKKGHKYYDC